MKRQARPLNVLLIEDNPGDADLIHEYATNDPARPVQLSVAPTLSTGIGLINSNKFDLLLLDLNLPDSFGIDTFKEFSIAAPRTPIIVITGSDDDSIVAQCMIQGAQDYLPKSWINRSLPMTIYNAVIRAFSEEKLRERIKETQCLYEISRLVSAPCPSLEHTLMSAVVLIPPGWQYPHLTCARIICNGEEFATSNFREKTRYRLTAAITVSEESVGMVEVGYLEDEIVDNDDPFLEEERHLIVNIARQLAIMVQRKQAQEREQHLNQVLQAIRNVNQLIVREHDEQRLIQRACELLVETRGYQGAWIALGDCTAPPWAIAQAGWGEPFAAFAEELKHGRWPHCCRQTLSVENGLVLLSPEESCADCVLWTHYQQRLVIVIALRCDIHNLGFLAISFPRGVVIDDMEKSLTFEVADDIAFAIHNLKLKRQQERLIEAIEQAGEIVVITDSKGAIQYVNPAFENITGYSKKEAIGKNPRILKSGHQDAAFYRELWQTISTGKTWRGRMVNKCKDGSLFTEDATISSVVDTTGNIVNYVAVKRDISEYLRIIQENEKMEEQARQRHKLEAIGRLAGGVAHDFNNMLSVILGYGEMLLAQLHRSDPLCKPAAQIIKAAKSSAGLTRQLLAFSRKQALQPRVLDLNEIVRDMEKILQRVIGEDIELKTLLDKGLQPVEVDPGQIEQVIMNLVVNSRDAMPKGGTLLIETTNIELDIAYARNHVGAIPGDYVLLAMSDNGCGMDEATREKAFEPFFTTKEQGKGTGLGLGHGLWNNQAIRRQCLDLQRTGDRNYF